jgi:3-mercaptopyruvate sulfurtransferase SseA
MTVPRLLSTTLAALLLVLLAAPLFSPNASADTLPSWWPDAQREAEDEGYGLLTSAELAELLAEPNDLLLVDSRPGYEYDSGHLPGAVSLEFDLGDRMGLNDERREEIRAVLGPDKDRLVVVYCRSFR